MSKCWRPDKFDLWQDKMSLNYNWTSYIRRKILIDDGLHRHDGGAQCCRRRAMNSNWNPSKGTEKFNGDESCLEVACLKALVAAIYNAVG